MNKHKMLFASKYNVSSPQNAAYYGILAAVGRARLYSPDKYETRASIKEYWAELLVDKAAKYIERPVDVEEFKQDIVDIKAKMNTKFPPQLGLFNNGKSGYAPGFRLAHAQKSLSIMLKHLWCNELTAYEPPVCPIDGIILKKVDVADAWTKVNDMRVYESHLESVRRVAESQNMTLAQWELQNWD